MKTYAITITPESPFGTPLKGDSIFGHFCWQAVHEPTLLRGGFDAWIDRYAENPFAIFSSAWPQIHQNNGGTIYCLPRHAMPASFDAAMSRKTRIESRKKEKRNKWLLLEKSVFRVDLANCRTANDREVFDHLIENLPNSQKRSLQYIGDDQKKPLVTATQSHNSINRLTLTTGKGFDPFSMENSHYPPGMQLVLFAAIDEEALDVDCLRAGLERIGQFGFGRDASTGLGRFSVGEAEELDWPLPGAGEGCYVLAPCVPEQGRFAEQFSVPFTRFGRHGDRLVLSGNPFKNPVVMADEGSVFFPAQGKEPDKPYIGRAVTGLSLVEKRTVAQGYALCLPLARRSQ